MRKCVFFIKCRQYPKAYGAADRFLPPNDPSTALCYAYYTHIALFGVEQTLLRLNR